MTLEKNKCNKLYNLITHLYLKNHSPHAAVVWAGHYLTAPARLGIYSTLANLDAVFTMEVNIYVHLIKLARNRYIVINGILLSRIPYRSK